MRPSASGLAMAVLTLALGAAVGAQEPVLVRAHAHNDYEHERPLLDALAVGCHSVEADVFLVDGELLVAHTRFQCVPGRTLRKLYLEPLAEKVRANQGRVAAGGPLEFQLLIDFKTGGAETYEALSAELAEYREMLTSFSDGRSRRPGAVLAVISGRAPDDVVLADEDRLCALDGWFDDIERGGTADQYPLMSKRWGSVFDWRGEGEFPAEEKAELIALCRRAHAEGRRIRFWAVPNRVECWREQLLAGVDWLNVDELEEARDFLLDGGLSLHVAAEVDRLLDDRHGDPVATQRLAQRLEQDGVDIETLEIIVRSDRVLPAPADAALGVEPQPGKLIGGLKLQCEHVDYETIYWLYLPKDFDPQIVYPLFLCGHGGNGAMRRQRANGIAGYGAKVWQQMADERGFIVAAPVTERGWGSIGNSIFVSLISKLQRNFLIDPDRIYVTGHSMGGHLSWRTALTMADRFAGVSPMSGGYDYVERGNMPRLWNIAGYATFGKQEPYGINGFNKKMAEWIEDNAYAHWRIVEKDGGHTFFPDEFPKIASFLLSRPRDPYREDVYVEGGAAMAWTNPGANERWGVEHTWVEGRPVVQSIGHWLEVLPRKDLPKGERQTARGRIDLEANKITIQANQVRSLRVWLSPAMVDFDRPVTIEVNGKVVSQGRPNPSLETLLERARVFDDRGRIYHTVVDVAIDTDQGVEPPVGGR